MSERFNKDIIWILVYVIYNTICNIIYYVKTSLHFVLESLNFVSELAALKLVERVFTPLRDKKYPICVFLTFFRMLRHVKQRHSL